jgi:hypothetical protein
MNHEPTLTERFAAFIIRLCFAGIILWVLWLVWGIGCIAAGSFD